MKAVSVTGFNRTLTVRTVAAAAAMLVVPAIALGQAETEGTLSVAAERPRPAHMAVKLPAMDPTRGRILFATKGCVICHEVNGVGGRRGKAPPLDAALMSIPPDPIEFAARMWRGAEAMIALQQEDLGYTVEIRPDELADIFAFVHNQDEQRLFTLPGRTSP